MLTITDEAFPYLVLQRGGIHDLRLHRPAWELAYHRQVAEQVDSLTPHLPAASARHVLDVGSGLGGVDLALHQAGHVSRVSLLDGVDDEPVVRLHRETFNDMGVARRWWQANGAELYSYVDTARVERSFADGARVDSAFDLVVSFGSWCFHYPPESYLAWIESRLARGAVVCLEVRNGKPEWRRHLENVLGRGQPIAEARKYTRLLFVRA